MATSSYFMRANAAARQLAERFKNLHVEETNGQTGPVPKFKNEYPSRIAIPTNVSQNNGPTAIIDVQPDFRNPISYIYYYTAKEYPDLAMKEYPILTPPSYIAYLLSVVYSHALLNDDENVRGKQSVYSQQFHNTINLDATLTQLRNLPVPPFMLPLLSSLYHGIDDRKPELNFVYSLAAFSLKHDFGRTLPITMFLKAHDLIANRSTSVNPTELINEWLQLVILEQPIELKIANYLGAVVEQANYPNWFSQLIYSAFNPVTLRSNTSRPVFQRIITYPQNMGNNIDDINPYIHLLGLDEDNIYNVTAAIKDLASSFGQCYPNSVALGSLENLAKGQHIISHYYQPILLPTWHSAAVNVTEGIVNTRAYSTRVNFLVPPVHNANVNIPVIEDEDEFNEEAYLCSGVQYNIEADPITYILFAQNKHVKSHIRHMCPFEIKNEIIFFNIISGKLIECSELDSASVPQPNPRNSIERENSYFLNSAVPFSHIRPITVTPQQNFDLVQRTRHSTTIPAVRIDLIDRSIDRLPIFDTQNVNPEEIDLTGFNIEEGFSHTKYGCNSLCYKINEGPNETTITHTRHVTAWSSYRFINDEQHETVPIQNRRLMILNTWTLFGTNATLVQTPHPSDCIPRV